MLELLLTLLTIALAFALVVVLGGRLAVNRMAKAVGRRHGDLEWVLNTGLAPHRWADPLERRLRLWRRLRVPPGTLDFARRRYKDRLERRLLGMVRYVERSNVVPESGTRRAIAGTLRHVGREWEQSSWEEIVPQEDRSESTGQ